MRKLKVYRIWRQWLCKNQCANHRTITFPLIVRPMFPCFLHHYCLPILYITNFLIENVLLALWILFITIVTQRTLTPIGLKAGHICSTSVLLSWVAHSDWMVPLDVIRSVSPPPPPPPQGEPECLLDVEETSSTELTFLIPPLHTSGDS